jgi:ketosteroid isomerase-like protein
VDDATSIGEQLVDAIAARDAERIAGCFADDASFHALVPRGLRERESAQETAALIAGWFGDASEFRLVEHAVEELSDKLHVSYRFEGVKDDEPFVLEQQLYATLADGRIGRADLLCSGFRPAA